MKGDPRRKHLGFHDTPRAMAAMDVDYPDGGSTGWHSHPRGQLLYAVQGVTIVHRAVWLAARSEHNVKMSSEVEIRTVFIDTTRIFDTPATSCVIDVLPLLRELIVAAVRIRLDYEEDSRDGQDRASAVRRANRDDLRAVAGTGATAVRAAQAGPRREDHRCCRRLRLRQPGCLRHHVPATPRKVTIEFYG